MKTYQNSLTGFRTKDTYTVMELYTLAQKNCISLIRLYNGHALAGEMFSAAADALMEQVESVDQTFTQEEATELLAICDAAVRDMLDH